MNSGETKAMKSPSSDLSQAKGMSKRLVDLSENRYRVVLEESWHHESPEIRNPNRRWYEQIPCKGGAFVGLYAETPETLLQLYTRRVKNARIIWEQLKDQPGCRADFHLDGEAMLFFPPEQLHQVAEMAGARIKRRLSPEARLKAAARGRAALEKYRQTNYQSANPAQIDPAQAQ